MYQYRRLKSMALLDMIANTSIISNMKAYPMLELHPIPAFDDNYIWLFHKKGQTEAYVVDPGHSAPVFRYLEDNDLSLAGIFVTHHHPDHIGGIDELIKQYPVPVYGPDSGRIKEITHPVSKDTLFEIAGYQWKVLEVPAHTRDHIAFYGESASQSPILFCGDTLFSAGCGRLFEGTPEQLLAALEQFSELPDNTQVCCAHEYTESNLLFAKAVEPNNLPLDEYSKKVQRLRQEAKPSLPSTIGTEKLINPFMRYSENKVIAAAAQAGADVSGLGGRLQKINVLAAIRKWKDNF